MTLFGTRRYLLLPNPHLKNHPLHSFGNSRTMTNRQQVAQWLDQHNQQFAQQLEQHDKQWSSRQWSNPHCQTLRALGPKYLSPHQSPRPRLQGNQTWATSTVDRRRDAREETLATRTDLHPRTHWRDGWAEKLEQKRWTPSKVPPTPLLDYAFA